LIVIKSGRRVTPIC